MDIERQDGKPARQRRVRVVSGPPEVVEAELNVLLDEYAVIAWNFTAVDDRLVVTTVLIHQRELRMAQIAGAAMNPGRAH